MTLPGCDASSVDEHNPDVMQKPDRIFGVLPNYTTVEKGNTVQPITAKLAFTTAAKNSFDVYVFPFIGVVAALGAGQGAGAYDRRYVTALADNTIGNFMTTAIVPSALHLSALVLGASSWLAQGTGATGGQARASFGSSS